jgi:FAD dependent oxidoreductase TIGR03364
MGLPMSREYDLAVVGAGILGLAHALAAAKLGKRVVVIDRDAQANGASIRNFGFVTVTGQDRGLTWRRAKRSCAVWTEVAAEAGIAVEQRGMMLTAQRPEALAVIEAFAETEMGEGCLLLSPQEARSRFPLRSDGTVSGALWSPHDLRVESRTAIPTLARWLEARWGVAFMRGVTVHEISAPDILTSNGVVRAEVVVACPGDDFTGLYADRIAARGLTRCRLQMLRLADPGVRLPGALMSDLSMIRYAGYAALPEAEALKARLEVEQSGHVANGIHLIVVQSADGSLVVGDSHHYADTPPPFASDAVDRLILDEYAALLGFAPDVTERWTGTYASGPDQSFVDAPEPAVRLVMVTSGSGASTGFAIAEEVVGQLYGVKMGVAA